MAESALAEQQAALATLIGEQEGESARIPAATAERGNAGAWEA